jgi:hypothetical protein
MEATFRLKRPCCYALHNKLVYAALVEAPDEVIHDPSVSKGEAADNDDGDATHGNANASTGVLVCNRAYHGHRILNRTRVEDAPVLLLEAPLMAPPCHAPTWEPLVCGDLVVALRSRRRVRSEQDPFPTSFKGSASTSGYGDGMDPYDCTIPSEMIAQVHLFRIESLGPLDALRAVPLRDLHDSIRLFAVSAARVCSSNDTMRYASDPLVDTTISPKNGRHDDEHRFKRSQVRKVVDYLPKVVLQSNGMHRKEQTSDRIRRILHGKLQAVDRSGALLDNPAEILVAESPMVEELRSTNVRLIPAGFGIGHATHSNAMTLEDITES